MLKAYKFRLYPNDEQKILINKTFGCSRYIYNYFLNEAQKYYKENKKMKSAYEMCNELKSLQEITPWLKEVDSCSLRTAIFDLEDAYKSFFQKRSKYPNFKNKYSKQSYRTNNMTSEYKGKSYNSIEINLKERMIKLPKLKEVKIRGYRNIEEIRGRVINATVTKDNTNRYYASVLYEQEEIIRENRNQSIIGIDLGIKDLVITSDGEKYSNEKVIIKYEKRIKHEQRNLMRKSKYSNNYKKAKERLSTLYRKLKNTRNYYIHKITKKLTRENKVIVVETLNIKEMSKNRNISKLILDASLSEIQRQLEYKSRSHDCKYYKIEEYYPSSQICNVCNHRNEKVRDLSIREYLCDECGTLLDRDINASINIMNKGLEKYIREIVVA